MRLFVVIVALFTAESILFSLISVYVDNNFVPFYVLFSVTYKKVPYVFRSSLFL